MKIFNQRRINRKGALQLSINAVVILILAIIGKIVGTVTHDPIKLVTFNTFEDLTVEAGGSEVVQLMISVDPSAPPTMYRCYMELKIIGGSSTDTGVYAKKRFEVDYKG